LPLPAVRNGTYKTLLVFERDSAMVSFDRNTVWLGCRVFVLFWICSEENVALEVLCLANWIESGLAWIHFRHSSVVSVNSEIFLIASMAAMACGLRIWWLSTYWLRIEVSCCRINCNAWLSSDDILLVPDPMEITKGEEVEALVEMF
jgi:hypothetical protein